LLTARHKAGKPFFAALILTAALAPKHKGDWKMKTRKCFFTTGMAALALTFVVLAAALMLTGCEKVNSKTDFKQASTLTTAAAVPANMVFVEGGSFMMGSTGGESNEMPVHQVTVKSFSMGKYEVTQEEWVAVMGSNPSNGKGDKLPVENVSWYEAVEYCNKLSLKEGFSPAYRGSGNDITCDMSANGYRLPTEAEWEYAASGGKMRDVPAQENEEQHDAAAWYDMNSDSRTHEVGTKAANALGLFDIGGNVWEWCWDRYGAYESDAQTNPTGASSGWLRVARGGSWGNDSRSLRPTYRINDMPSHRIVNLGFRLLRPSL
jgi:formylglycine-generating enzyme required for sulfatase activity